MSLGTLTLADLIRLREEGVAVADKTKLEPDPDEPDDEDEDLPTTLPAKAVPSKFSPAAIDYSFNTHLQELIPKEANQVTFSVRAVSADGEEKILTGVVAGRVDAGKFDIGAALGAHLDLDNRKNWSVEFLGVVSWS